MNSAMGRERWGLVAQFCYVKKLDGWVSMISEVSNTLTTAD
jgi:hypothetical protein